MNSERFDWIFTDSRMYGFFTLIFFIMFALFFRQASSYPRTSWLKKSPIVANNLQKKFSSNFPTFTPEEKEKMIAEKTWNLKGVKDEVNRLYLRAIKKVGKANERLQATTAKENSGIFANNSELDQIMEDLQSWQTRVKKLKDLEDMLQSIKNANDERFVSLVPTLVHMEINDAPPERPEKQPKKPKGKPAPPRKPYFVYKSADDIEIYVGRGASDNDEVSTNPEIRHNDEWWLHVSGYAGSHVVIKCRDEDLPSKYRETVLDAAILAAVNSKAASSSRVAVSLTRCRNVSKPRLAKPGLVHISGDIRTINIDMKVETKRLERLQKVE